MAQSKHDVWMPFYVGDYLRDTQHLTAEAHGAYLLLILAAWGNGGRLPDDDEQLMAICKIGADRWPKMRVILGAFFDISDGFWTQKRVKKELSRARRITEERSKAGKNGAKSRWQNDSKAMANAMAKPWQNDAPSPSPSHKNSISVEVLIIAALDEETAAAFGKERVRPFPHPKDQVFAARWAAEGATADFCRPIFAQALRSRAAQGGEPIGTLSYFDKPVMRALAEVNGPIGQQGASASGAAPILTVVPSIWGGDRFANWELRLLRWIKTGEWGPWGDPPDHSTNLVPDSLHEKYRDQIAERTRLKRAEEAENRRRRGFC